MTICSACTYDNPPSAKKCEICENELMSKIEIHDNSDHGTITNTSVATIGKDDSRRSIEKLSSGIINCVRCTVQLPSNSILECPICGNVIQNKRDYDHNKITKVSLKQKFKDDKEQEYRQYLTEEQRKMLESGSKYFPSPLATDYVMHLLDEKLRHPSKIHRLSNITPHISQAGVEGSRWSCGYRNIQMLCCSLMEISKYKSRLFHGKGEVPDINGIQSWIEKAWNDGFDLEVI